MDALSKAAIESLLKKILPGLNDELSALAMEEPENLQLSEQGQYFLGECLELLNLIKNSSQGSAATPPQASEQLSDEEALRLLQEMEGGPSLAQVPDTKAEKPTEIQSNETISDSEAARLLAAMEGQENETPKPTPTQESCLEVSDSSTDEGDLEEIDEWEANDFQTDPDMIQDFNANSEEIMTALDEAILQLEKEPDNKEIIEEIFRGAHTLKGAAGMFGFKALERVMHRMENLFDLIRKNRLAVTSDTVDVVFQGLDLLRVLLQAVKDGKPCGAETVPVVIALEQAARGQPSKIVKAAPTSDTEIKAQKPASSGVDKKTASKDAQSPQKKDQTTIRVDLDRLDALVNLVGELVIDRTRFASIEEELRTSHPQIELSNSISETVQLFGRHMNEIQDIIMKVRMVPIGNAFNKFTRIVRDLSRSLGKDIELVISGENAELDKTMVEQIGDPLIHLIRNSCDHGIEIPDDRVQAGKASKGVIKLSAHQEGNHIVIMIRDDGKGMNPEQIRSKAIEKGLISEDETLSNRDIFNLIFEPGFSTVEKVTNISGRGVGMDVVKKQIMKLKGMIEIDSTLGAGTVISIRLPLTLAIVQSLLVRSLNETFAIPLGSVIESIRISPSEIQKVGETEVYKLRDKVLPLVHLHEVLELNRKEGSVAQLLQETSLVRRIHERRSKKNERLFIVVVGHADRPTGIIVDQLLNQQEMVIKSMGSLMQDIPCVAGGAVLGHGEVVLVLDIPELEHLTKSRTRGLVA